MANVSLDEVLLKDAVLIIANSKTDVFPMGQVSAVLGLLQDIIKEQGTKEEVKVVTPEVVKETSTEVVE